MYMIFNSEKNQYIDINIICNILIFIHKTIHILWNIGNIGFQNFRKRPVNNLLICVFLFGFESIQTGR